MVTSIKEKMSLEQDPQPSILLLVLLVAMIKRINTNRMKYSKLKEIKFLISVKATHLDKFNVRHLLLSRNY